MWFLEIRKYQVDYESRIVSGNDDFVIDAEYVSDQHDDEIDRILGNLKMWIDDAKSSYSQLSRRFERLIAAGREIYEKHYPLFGEDKQQAANRSKSGVSILEHKLTPCIQNVLLWRCMIEAFANVSDTYPGDPNNIGRHEEVGGRFNQFFLGPTLMIGNDCGEHCGWDNGRPTRFLLWNINLSTPIAHAYPVSGDEFRMISYRTEIPLWSLSDEEGS